MGRTRPSERRRCPAPRPKLEARGLRSRRAERAPRWTEASASASEVSTRFRFVGYEHRSQLIAEGGYTSRRSRPRLTSHAPHGSLFRPSMLPTTSTQLKTKETRSRVSFVFSVEVGSIELPSKEVIKSDLHAYFISFDSVPTV